MGAECFAMQTFLFTVKERFSKRKRPPKNPHGAAVFLPKNADGKMKLRPHESLQLLIHTAQYIYVADFRLPEVIDNGPFIPDSSYVHVHMCTFEGMDALTQHDNHNQFRPLSVSKSAWMMAPRRTGLRCGSVFVYLS